MPQQRIRRPPEKQPSPKHPGNDPAMPPYTPGGVPEPEGPPSATENEREGEAPPSGYPPKREP